MERIVVKNLHFNYDEGEEILKGVNLCFDNEPTAIIGQNGAGKTTFVKLIKGLLKPSSGSIYIHGQNTSELTAARIAKDVGLVFQNPSNQLFKATVLEEVMFGPLNISQSAEEAHENAILALKSVGLDDELQTHPFDLSPCERRLLCIASVIAMGVSTIILDEPTIAQDYTGKERIKDLIHQLKNQGKLILAISHDMDFVAENFGRAVVFWDGKVLKDDDVRRIFRDDNVLLQAGLCSPQVTRLGKRLGSTKTILSVREFVELFREGRLINKSNEK